MADGTDVTPTGIGLFANRKTPVIDFIMDVFNKDDEDIYADSSPPTVDPVFETKYFDESTDVTADQAYEAILGIGHQDFTAASFVRIRDEFENLAATQNWSKADIDKTKLYIQHLWETNPEDRAEEMENIKAGRIDFDMTPYYQRDWGGGMSQVSPITEGSFANYPGLPGPEDDQQYARQEVFGKHNVPFIGDITAGYSVEDPEAVEMLPGPTTYYEDVQYWNPGTQRYGSMNVDSKVPPLRTIVSDTIYPMVQDAGVEGVEWPPYQTEEGFIQDKYYPMAEYRAYPENWGNIEDTTYNFTTGDFQRFVNNHGIHEGIKKLMSIQEDAPSADLSDFLPIINEGYGYEDAYGGGAMGQPIDAQEPYVDPNSVLQQWYEDNPFRRFKAGN